ncbi:hypothetical protein RSUY_44140 (plasmid) [Ralstonia solanacearum]|nr:hypothetical protein RSUY_44140 [Ralstonia solanacearum]
MMTERLLRLRPMAATAYARRLTKPPSMFRGSFLLNRRDTQLPGHFQHQGFSPHFSQDSKKLRYGVWRLLKVFCRPTNRTRCRFGFGSVHLVQKLTHAHHSHTKPGHGFLGHVLDVLAHEDDAIRLAGLVFFRIFVYGVSQSERSGSYMPVLPIDFFGHPCKIHGAHRHCPLRAARFSSPEDGSAPWLAGCHRPPAYCAEIRHRYSLSSGPRTTFLRACP